MIRATGEMPTGWAWPISAPRTPRRQHMRCLGRQIIFHAALLGYSFYSMIFSRVWAQHHLETRAAALRRSRRAVPMTSASADNAISDRPCLMALMRTFHAGGCAGVDGGAAQDNDVPG